MDLVKFVEDSCPPQILFGLHWLISYNTDTKMLKQFRGFIVVFLNRNIKYCLTQGSIPNDFKKAHKRDSSNSGKKNAKLIILLQTN